MRRSCLEGGAAQQVVKGVRYARGRGVDPVQSSPCTSSAGPQEVVDQVDALLETGLDGLIFNMGHTHDPEAIHLTGETLAPLHKTGSGKGRPKGPAHWAGSPARSGAADAR